MDENREFGVSDACNAEPAIMQTHLIHFFQRILQQDSATLSALAGYGEALYFDQANAVLIFRLSGLHQFMTEDEREGMNYAEFKKMIYAGNLNEKLQRLGGKVEIHGSHGKVDQNVYKLVQI
jgi:hypothetical protein